MGKVIWIGKDNVARRISNLHERVDGVARKIKAGHISVDGVARSFIPSYTLEFYVDPYSSVGTYNDGYARIDGDVWSFYLNTTTSSTPSSSDVYGSCVSISGDIAGKTLSVTGKLDTYRSGTYGVIQTYDEDWNNELTYTTIKSTSDVTRTLTIPSNAVYVDIWLCHQQAGTCETTLTISSVKIDGEELV